MIQFRTALAVLGIFFAQATAFATPFAMDWNPNPGSVPKMLYTILALYREHLADTGEPSTAFENDCAVQLEGSSSIILHRHGVTLEVASRRMTAAVAQTESAFTVSDGNLDWSMFSDSVAAELFSAFRHYVRVEGGLVLHPNSVRRVRGGDPSFILEDQFVRVTCTTGQAGILAAMRYRCKFENLAPKR